MTSSKGLVGHWEFQEKSGTTAFDSSRYKNNGTLSGSTLPKWQEKGLYFNGSTAYVDCGNKASLNITNNITISAWVKPIAWNSSFPRILSKKNAYSLAFEGATGKMVFLVVQSGINKEVYSTNSVSLNSWYHIVGTYSSIDSFRLYLNGNNQTLTGDTTVVGSFDSNTNSVYIGNWQDLVRFFNGTIDEVRIYNRALNASEIRDLYDSTKHNYR